LTKCTNGWFHEKTSQKEKKMKKKRRMNKRALGAKKTSLRMGAKL
jgi:hypothetical protein